jgi:hypothetical protein
MSKPEIAPAIDPNASISLTFDQLRQLIAEAKAPAAAPFDVDKFAEAHVKANQAMSQKENKVHPHKSAFSHPDGDIAHPRPTMRCETSWYGHKVTEDGTHTYQEMELLNQIEPGDYLCARPDGALLPVHVVGEYHPQTRALTKISVEFAPEDGRNVPSMVTWLKEIIEQQNARSLVTA